MSNKAITDLNLRTKLTKLQSILHDYGNIAIAFSGGVDSSLLLKVSHDILKKNTIGIFADSIVQPPEEKQGAIDLADFVGCRLQVISFDLFTLPEFVKNPKDRCYHCKHAIFSSFLEFCSTTGFAKLADGTNVDDCSDDRPGAKAVKELGVKSPLLEAGLTKKEIRQLSKELGLPTWNKPSASCLATRIPADTTITSSDLKLVQNGENFLHKLGFAGCRLRIHKNDAFIELVEGDINNALSRDCLQKIRHHLMDLGIQQVFINLSERKSILT